MILSSESQNCLLKGDYVKIFTIEYICFVNMKMGCHNSLNKIQIKNLVI